MPSTRTVTSIGLSGLAKLSCTPPQHTGMSVEVSSVGGAVMLEGTAEYQMYGGNYKYTVTQTVSPMVFTELIGNSNNDRQWVTGPH